MRKEKRNFKLQDEFVKEEDQIDTVDVQLTSTKINFSLLQLFKYSQYVQEEFLHNFITNNLITKLQKIEKENHIKSESIKTFFKFIEDGELFITEDEYFDLYKLSEIFKVNPLKKCLQNYTRENSSNINFLIELILNQQSTKSEFFSSDLISIDAEELLKDQIDKCLSNKKFGKLPISTIYRILEKSKENLKSSDLLYDFIIESIEERCSLFQFIQFNSISDEKFIEIFEYYQQNKNSINYFHFLPVDLKYIKTLKDEKQSLEKKVKEIERKSQEQQELLKKKINDFDDKNKKLEKENNNLQTQINKILNDHKEKVNLIKNDFEQQIRKITKNNDQLKIEIEKLEQKNKSFQAQINKIIDDHLQKENRINSEFEQKINELTKNNDVLKAQIANLEKEKKDQKLQIDQLNSQIQKLKSENKKCIDEKEILVKKVEKEKEKGISLPYTGNNVFNGIINYLKINKNVDDYLRITSSSEYSDHLNKNVIRFDSRKYFASDDIQNSWICFEFINHFIILQNYTFRFYSRGGCNPKSWIVEGSNDNIKWDFLSNQDSTFIRNESNLTHTFKIENANNKKFKFIRLRQPNQNFYNDNHFCIDCIEFYGNLI